MKKSTPDMFVLSMLVVIGAVLTTVAQASL